MSNEEMVDHWLRWLAGGELSPNTLRLRGYLIRVFARQYDLGTATAVDVQRYLASLPGSVWSRASHLASLRGFYRWAVLAGHLASDPTALVHGIRVPAGVPRPVPEHVLSNALASADPQTRLMLLLGAYAGLRRAEIAGLHSERVSDTHLTITGKGGRTRQIPIHPLLRPSVFSFEGYAFPSAFRRGFPVRPPYVARRVALALGSPWTTHSLRHRCATRAYRGTRDIRAVQQLLGHSSPDVTSRYVAAEMDALTAAVVSIA